MTPGEWAAAFVVIGLVLMCSLIYVGYMIYKAQVIRKKNRENKSADLGTSFGKTVPDTQKVPGSPKPKRLEAALKMPRSPYSGGEVHKVRVQPLLLRRNGSGASPLSPLITKGLGSVGEGPFSPTTPMSATPLGSLDPSLYTTELEVESAKDEFQSDESLAGYQLGQVHFTVQYDIHRSALTVTLNKATNLSLRESDWNKQCNPYAIVQLLPDYRHQLQSTTHRKTNDPYFDEKFEFEVSYKELVLQTLWLTVLSFDSFSKHEVIGQISIPLADIDVTSENVFQTELRPSLKKRIELGELMISLGYLKSAQRLTVVIIKARNLPAVNIKGTDPHVKVALIHAGKRIRKKRTTSRKCDLNPVFNEAVSFDISLEMINNVDLLLSVMHENDPVGCVLIGVHATGKELEHWKEMRTAARPIANWHKLQEPKKFY